MLERFRNPDNPFLEATWSNICIVSYRVPPDTLEERIPDPLELRTTDGDALASLVALDFEKTKVWGVGWPGFRSFPEVHLHVHVRYGDHRGVWLVREFVPQPFVAWFAGLLYSEPYESVPMESNVAHRDDQIEVRHRWSHGGTRHELHLVAGDQATTPDESSAENEFKEFRWGFGSDSDGSPFAFEVDHPVWATHPVESLDLKVDWDVLFGREWSVLADREPVSVLLAEGSPITVYPKQTLEGLENER